MESEARFVRYIASLAGVLGHGDRAEPLKDYCAGLLMPVERKSVAPMAAMVSPAHGGDEALIVDATGYQKKGTHSVGVARGVVRALPYPVFADSPPEMPIFVLRDPSTALIL